jgi:hypothetical protein
VTPQRRNDRSRSDLARLNAYSDAALVDALAIPEYAELAAELIRERLCDQPEQFHDGVLAAVAALHDISRRLDGGLTGPQPLAALRAFARAEIARRGGEALRPLCPSHAGVRCRAALEGHDGEVRVLLPLDGGALASVEAGGGRLLWQLETGRRLAPLRRDDGVGESAVLRWRDGAVAVSRPGAQRASAELALPAGSIPAVAGGRLALVEGGPSSATVSVREIAGGRVLWSRAGFEWDHRSGDTLDVTLSPGGRFLAIGQGYGAHLELVDLAGGSSSTFASESDAACLVALGTEPLAVLSVRGGTVVRDLAAGAEVLALAGTGPAAIASGAALMVRGVGTRVELRDLDGGPVWGHETRGAVDRVFASPDGALFGALVRGAWDDEEHCYRSVARMWSRDGAETAAIHGACALAVLPGGRGVATGGRWGTVWLWQTEPDLPPVGVSSRR